jgi:hypothetical protein
MVLTREKKKDEDEEELLASRVRGPSRDPNDIVCANCELPDLQVGYWLLFDRMGAYTLFLLFPSVSVLKQKDPAVVIAGRLHRVRE